MTENHLATVGLLNALEARYHALVQHHPIRLAIRVGVESALFQLRRTLEIVQAFLSEDVPRNDGGGWLRVVGVLQALFVQQDSMQRLLDSFEIEREFARYWAEIRDKRNSLVGHPIERHGGSLRSAYFAESADGSELAILGLRRVFYGGEADSFEEVDLYELIGVQGRILKDVLASVLAGINRRVESVVRDVQDEEAD
jgi:hypothetical protein